VVVEHLPEGVDDADPGVDHEALFAGPSRDDIAVGPNAAAGRRA
jgi:hypothetical protein